MSRKYVRTNWAVPENVPSGSEFQLPITREEVLKAECKWGRKNRSSWISQRNAIEVIASDIWSTRENDIGRLHRLWVMLAYAIGNFKRQGGTVIFPLPSPWKLEPLTGEPHVRDELSIPVNDSTLTLNSHGTTESLGSIRGLGSVPTGSTLLSALWPDEHAIMDRRNFRATVGILASGGARVLNPNEAARLRDPDWNEYRWFRVLLKNETERLELPSPIYLERALYEAFSYRPKEAADGRTWAEWGNELLIAWKESLAG